MKTFLRKSGILAIVLVIANLFFANAAFGQATVTTDKDDYAPGETVTITGSGFQGDETVTLQVLHQDPALDNLTSLTNAHLPWDIVALADGSFTAMWIVPLDEDEIGATLLLSAKGQTSGLLAEAVFTDAQFSVTIDLPSGTICSGGSITLTATATGSASTPYSYSWSPGGMTTQAITVNPTTTTTYTVTAAEAKSNPKTVTASSTFTTNSVTPGVIAKGATQPGPGCDTLDPGITSVTTAATGSGTLSYIWQQSTDGGTSWSTIALATSDQYNPLALTVTTSFKRIATSTLNSVVCSSESNMLTYVVNPLPTVASILPGGTTNVCVGSTSQLSNATPGGVWSSANSGIATVNSSGLVNGIASGDVIISYTVTDGNSCSKTANKTVHVLALPTAPTAVNYTGTYDGVSHTSSASAGAGETIDWYFAATGTTTSTAPTGTNAGTYSAYVEARNTTTGCVSATRTLVTLTINKVALTVTADAKVVTYGDAVPALTYTLTGFVNNETPSVVLGAASLSTSYTNTTSVTVSPVTITTAIGTLSATNYSFPTLVNGQVTIGKKTASVIVDLGQTKVYGSSDPAFTGVLAGFIPADAVTASYARVAGETVGTYAISATLAPAGVLANYNITNTGANFAITAMPITVTATAGQTKVYGASNPASYTYSSSPTGLLANGQTVSFTGALDRAVGENVGTTYAIGQGTLANSNYTITYSGANFAITAMPIAVTATAGQSKVYGALDPTFAYTSVPTGTLANGQTVSFTGALDRAAGENVGNWAIGQGSLANSNYAITYVPANLTINTLAVTVTADTQSKTYGSVDPALTFVSSPAVGSALANTDVISFTGSLSRAAGETVLGSPYAIGQNDLANSNYAITYTGANLTIGQLAVAVNAVAKNKTYGDVDPALTFVSVPAVGSALANGETISFVGALSRASGESVNTYAINQNTVDNSNYAITYTGANLTIGQLAVTVTADAKVKYCGQASPTLTYISNPVVSTVLANGETISFVGLLSRDLGDNAGTYTIKQNTVANSNYNITYYSADFKIIGTTIDASASSNPVPVNPGTAILKATVSPLTVIPGLSLAGIPVNFNLDNGNNGTSDYPTVTDATGFVTTTTTPLPVELYLVTATAGSCASATAYLPVYDPNGSFITGGGWINSPVGAYTANVSLTGKANFGFNAKYKKGNNQVDGNTEFQFQTANFNFKSNILTAGTLVISGAKATFRGEGTVNGSGTYGFLVAAIDGAINGGGGTDTFRIKIWDKSNGNNVVYDNQLGASENLDATTLLGGGSIVIHEVKKGTTGKVETVKEVSEPVPFNVIAYPNPAKYQFTLVVEGGSTEKIDVMVYDVLGKTIKHIESSDNQPILFGDELPTGVYIAIINQGMNQKTVRLIKQ